MPDESIEESINSNAASKIKTVVLSIIIGAILFLLIFAASRKPSNAEKAWDEATTIGNMEAKNYYVMYTDIMCPYCDVFSRLTIQYEENFKIVN